MCMQRHRDVLKGTVNTARQSVEWFNREWYLHYRCNRGASVLLVTNSWYI